MFCALLGEPLQDHWSSGSYENEKNDMIFFIREEAILIHIHHDIHVVESQLS